MWHFKNKKQEKIKIWMLKIQYQLKEKIKTMKKAMIF